jgi:transposase
MDQRLRTLTSTATPRGFVYAAGPCGYWRSRDLSRKHLRGWVVAPALVPQQAGDRVKTDRRDATQRARLLRSGAVTAVYVPTVEDAAIRDRARARAEASRERQAAKHRLPACLRRQDSRSAGRATWGPAPLRWLAAGVCPTPAQPLVFPA